MQINCGKYYLYSYNKESTHVIQVYFFALRSSQRDAGDHSDGQHRFETFALHHPD